MSADGARREANGRLSLSACVFRRLHDSFTLYDPRPPVVTTLQMPTSTSDHFWNVNAFADIELVIAFFIVAVLSKPLKTSEGPPIVDCVTVHKLSYSCAPIVMRLLLVVAALLCSVFAAHHKHHRRAVLVARVISTDQRRRCHKSNFTLGPPLIAAPVIDDRGADLLIGTIREDQRVVNVVPHIGVVADTGEWASCYSEDYSSGCTPCAPLGDDKVFAKALREQPNQRHAQRQCLFLCVFQLFFKRCPRDGAFLVSSAPAHRVSELIVSEEVKKDVRRNHLDVLMSVF
uniref:Secreted protein n=1 Tax=Steinernema glaseri TaxID=37863 RepID=A0A1I8A7F2_9BILA